MIEQSEKSDIKPIMFLTDIFGGLGGAERNTFQIAYSMTKRGYKPIICAVHGGFLINEIINGEISYFNETDVKNLKIINLNIKRIYSIRGILNILKIFMIIKRNSIKLIVSYHITSDILGAMISFFTKIPVISSRRDMGFNLKKRHFLIYRKIDRLFYKIIVVSNALKDFISSNESVTKDKIKTIYNGTDITYFSKAVNTTDVKKKFGLSESKSIIGMLAGFREIKGHRYFIKAIPVVLQEIADVQFVIFGDVSNEHEKTVKNDLDKLILKLKILNYISFYKTTPKVNEILQTIDILVVPSLSEGFSNTIIEAMASGKPVIATNVGGNPESVVEGQTGLIIPKKDSKKLGKAILKLLYNKELAHNMGIEGRRRAEEKFSLKKMIDETDMVFKSALENDNRR